MSETDSVATLAGASEDSIQLRRIRFLGFLQIPLILIAFMTLSYVGWRVKTVRTQLDVLNHQVEAAKSSLNQKRTELAQTEKALAEANAELGVKRLAVAAASKPRSASIQYFPKGADGDRVEKALRDLGFQFKSGTPQLADVPTNTIWYGSAVDAQELKIVASALVEGDIKLKLICRLRNDDSKQRKTLIQIGATSNIDGRPLLTKEDIMRGRAIPHGSNGQSINGHLCSPG